MPVIQAEFPINIESKREMFFFTYWKEMLTSIGRIYLFINGDVCFLLLITSTVERSVESNKSFLGKPLFT